MCANGCRLVLTDKDDQTLELSGNFCGKGLGFAYRLLPDKTKTIRLADQQSLSTEQIERLLRGWRKELLTIHPGIFIHGSPERTLFRMVVEDTNHQKYILEQIAGEEIAHKRHVAEIIAFLANHQLPVVPYVAEGQVIQELNGTYWQLSRYVTGVPLDRSAYWQDAWRGEALADFLITLRVSVKDLAVEGEPFSLPGYIQALLATLKSEQPKVYEALAVVRDRLSQNLFPVYDLLPIGFVHGDPHPLNMIWGEKEILAVIDWEFSGPKARLYDPALIIGCVGSEAPDALTAGLVRGFLAKLAYARYFTESEFAVLPDFILAVRFAWLSEWLRRGDEEMLNNEIAYMRHLAEI